MFFRPKKAGVTAKELMDRLKRDPEYQARMAHKSAEHEKKVGQNSGFVKDLLRSLDGAGCRVDSLDEIFARREAYALALPVLLRTLRETEKTEFKRIVVCYLSVPWACPTSATGLIEEFEKANDESLKWQIGNALRVVADDSVFDAVCRLARTPQYGKAREMVTLALGKMKNPAAVTILTELLGDDVVCGHAVMALGDLRAKVTMERIIPFLQHPKEWIRQEAQKALASLEG